MGFIVGKETINTRGLVYSQKEYVSVKRKVGKHEDKFNVGKFKNRIRSREAPSVSYRVYVRIMAKLYGQKDWIKTSGTSHLIKYYSVSNFKQGYNQALSQARAYAFDKLYNMYIKNYDSELEAYMQRIVSVKILRIKYFKH